MTLADLPAPPFTHLRRLTDAGGLYEHAEWTRPRAEHGYCLDDVARGLVVMSRETATAVQQDDLYAQYLAFVLEAQGEDGRFLNRKSADLSWHGDLSVEDCWGRAVWALGSVVSGYGPQPSRDQALQAFEAAITWSSPWSRATAFAGLGAAEVLSVVPGHEAARAFLTRVLQQMPGPTTDVDWRWPEPRLTYANAALPEVLIAAGSALGDAAALENGLVLLGWLLELETADGHLSVTPVGGRGPGEDDGPAFDQQPIEVAALADACARAFAVTQDPRWAAAVRLAGAWFFGANDAGVSLYDPTSGGGCDGLEVDGRNENQGAESTLALISTLQQVRWLSLRTG